MDSFFDFIFSNIVIIIAIGAGILKFLSGNKGNGSKTNERKKHTPMHRPGPGSPVRQQNQQRTARVPRPTPTPSGPTNTASVPTYDKQTSVASSASIEEQQQKQMERLAGRMNTTEAIKHMEQMDEGHHKALHGKKDGGQPEGSNQRAFRRQMKKQMSRNGLIEGVIMSEVLGPPRARKPYKNIIAKRHEK